MSLICQSNLNINHNLIIFNEIKHIVSFFPQMRPEKKTPTIELGDDEKVILEILNSQPEPMFLNIVKEKSQLSGKKWDKATKNLSKNNLVKVEKIDENLMIVLI